MNTLRSLCITAVALTVSTGVFAASPAVQAPTPQIDTQWALAAVEEAPQAAAAVSLERPALVTQDGNSWSFNDVVDGQLIEIEITEIAATLAQEIAKRAAQAAFDLAGI